MLIGFKPDEIQVNFDGVETKRENVIIGIYNKELSKNGGYAGLVGLEILEYGKE